MCLFAKKPHILWDLGFEKYFVVSFWSDSIRAFSVLLEDSLRINSKT
jgi:hypothetical protein